MESLFVSFTKFHGLNDSQSYSPRSCRSVFRNYGKILASFTYFDYDQISDDQYMAAMSFKVKPHQIDDFRKVCKVHDYMMSLKNFYKTKSLIIALAAQTKN